AAAQLDAKVGDFVIVRVEKPGQFSRDAPLSGDEGDIVSIREKVVRIVGDQEFGRFSLQAGQVPPFNVFLPRSLLQDKTGLKGKANLFLMPNAGLFSAGNRTKNAPWWVGVFDWVKRKAAGDRVQALR